VDENIKKRVTELWAKKFNDMATRACPWCLVWRNGEIDLVPKWGQSISSILVEDVQAMDLETVLAKLATRLEPTLPLNPPHKVARDILNEIYLDYFNNYATIMTYADQHGLTEGQAGILIALARDVHTSNHPES
jgi:hypothetical protein